MNLGFASDKLSVRSTCCIFSTVWFDRLTVLNSNEYFQWPGPIKKVLHCWSVTLFATVSSVFTICFWHAFIPRWGSAPLLCMFNPKPRPPQGPWDPGSPWDANTDASSGLFPSKAHSSVLSSHNTHTPWGTHLILRASRSIMGQSGSTSSRSAGCAFTPVVDANTCAGFSISLFEQHKIHSSLFKGYDYVFWNGVKTRNSGPPRIISVLKMY